VEAAAPGPEPSVRLGLIGLAGLLATSLLVCLSATQSELLLPTSLRPLPESLAGPLAGAGLKLGVFALIAAFGVMFASYWAATRAAEKLSARTVVIAILALHLIVLLAPPLFSLLVTSGFLVPWYVAWLLPLAALSSDRRLLTAAVVLTGVGLTTL
jgi:hypothetical protein